MMQEIRLILAVKRDGQGLREGYAKLAADGEEDKQSLPYCKISGDEAAAEG